MKMKKKKKPKELEWEIKIIEKMILNIDLLKGVTVIHYKYQAYTRYKSWGTCLAITSITQQSKQKRNKTVSATTLSVLLW